MHGHSNIKFSEKSLLRRKSGPKTNKLNVQKSFVLILFYIFFLEDESSGLPENAWHQLPTGAAPYLRRMENFLFVCVKND